MISFYAKRMVPRLLSTLLCVGHMPPCIDAIGSPRGMVMYVYECVIWQCKKRSTVCLANMSQFLLFPFMLWLIDYVDFIIHLRLTEKVHDATLVYVNRLTTMASIAHTRSDVHAESGAQLFMSL